MFPLPATGASQPLLPRQSSASGASSSSSAPQQPTPPPPAISKTVLIMVVSSDGKLWQWEAPLPKYPERSVITAPDEHSMASISHSLQVGGGGGGGGGAQAALHKPCLPARGRVHVVSWL